MKKTHLIVSIVITLALCVGLTAALSMTAFAAETTYPLKIAGVEVTSDNCTAITGDAITGGSVSYALDTNTLTLNGATITSDLYYVISYTGTEDFTINLVGENTLTTNAANTPCITADSAKIIISGGGSLTATGGSYSLGIYVSELAINNTTVTANGENDGIRAKNITISGSTVNATATAEYGSGIYGQSDGTITIENGSKVTVASESGYGIQSSGSFSISGSTLTASGAYGLYCSGATTITNSTVKATATTKYGWANLGNATASISGTSHILASGGEVNWIYESCTLNLPESTYYWRNSADSEFTDSTTPATDSNVKTTYFELYTEGHAAYTPNDDGTTHSLGCPDGCAVNTISSGTSEAHTWEDGECEVCGATCVHDENTVYENGFCTVCGGYEPAVRVSADNYKELGFTAENYEGYVGYYAIGNAGHLYWFADYVNTTHPGANAVLTADITVNSGVLTTEGALAADTSSFKDWTPIGDVTYTYSGTFDGQGHTISGLYFSNENTDYVGLFGYVRDGTVKNVGVVDSYLCGKEYVGGVVGYLCANFGSANVENCYNTGTVSDSAYYVGGVVGYCEAIRSNSVSVENCYNTGTVSGSAYYVGGVVGYLYSGGEGSKASIENCYNTGNVSGISSSGSKYVGGVVGQNHGYDSGTATVANCYNTGSVSGSTNSTYVGGVAGNAYSSNNGTATIENCYYLTNCATDGKVYQNGIGASSYGNATEDDESGKVTAVKDKDAFGSGEVAYLLNGSKSEGVWKQTLDTDDSPNFTGKTVYQSGTGYTNHEHNWSYADGDYAYQIYATCTAEGCTLTGRVTITLGAPEGTYDGTTAHTVGVSDDSLEFTVPEDAITYTANDEGGALTNGLPVNAGSYTATLTLGEGTDAKTATVTYTIAKAPLTITAEAKSKVYGEDNPALTYVVSGLIGQDTLSGSLATTATKMSNVGEYDITIGDLANSNYTISYTGAKLTITKAASSVTIAPVAVSDLTYNGGEQDLITAGTADGGTVQYSLDNSTWSPAIPTGKDADSYTVYYKVVSDINHEDTAVQSVSVTIAPKTVTTPAFDGLEAQYVHTGSAIEPTFTLKDGETTIPASEYTVAYSNNVSEGTATITITDKDGGNYTVSGSKTFEIVVHAHVWKYSASENIITAKCEGTIGTCPVEGKTVTITLVAPTSLTYDGSEKVVTVEQSPAGVFTDVSDVAYTGDRTNVTAGGFTAKVTYGEQTAELPLQIAVATPTIAWAGENPAATVDYTGNAAEITAPTVTLVNNEQFGGVIKYSYTGTSSGDGLPTNAGTYYVTASIAADGNYAFASTENKLTLTINKIDSVVTSPTAVSDLTYNGKAQTLITSGSATGGTMQYKLGEDGEWSDTVPTAKDPATYTVYYKVVGNDNYNDNAGGSVEVTIAECPHAVWTNGVCNACNTVCEHVDNWSYTADETAGTVTAVCSKCGNAITASVTVSNLVYNGTAKVAEVTYSTEKYSTLPDATITGYTGDRKNVTAEGFTVTMSWGGITVSKTFAVAPRAIDVAWGNTVFEYNYRIQVPSASPVGLVPGDSCEILVLGDGKTGGMYVATAIDTTNSNYKLRERFTCVYTINGSAIEYAIEDIENAVYDAACDAAKTLGDCVADALGEAAEAAKSAASDAVADIGSCLTDAIDGAVDAAPEIVSDLGDALCGVAEDVLDSASDAAADIGNSMAEEFDKATSEAKTELCNKVNEMGDSLADCLCKTLRRFIYCLWNHVEDYIPDCHCN